MTWMSRDLNERKVVVSHEMNLRIFLEWSKSVGGIELTSNQSALWLDTGILGSGTHFTQLHTIIHTFSCSADS